MWKRLWVWLELIFHIPALFHIKFSIRSPCGSGCRYDWSWFFIFQVYSILNSLFDLTMVKVGGIIGGDFWCTKSIQYSISMWKRLWGWLELIFDIPDLFHIKFGIWFPCGGGCWYDWRWFWYARYSISLWGRLWVWLELIFYISSLFHIKFVIWFHCGKGCEYDWRWILTCQVYSVFDLNVEEIVGMTGANFSHSRSIPH